MVTISNIGIISLGCSKNLVDSEIMIGLLKEKGHIIVTDEAKADIIIINTCAFIDSAKSEAIDTVLEMAQYKQKGVLKKLIVTGCLAERYSDEILKEMPEVDAVVGVGRFTEIADIAESTETVFVGNKESEYPECAPRIISTPPYMAYLKIAEGCSNYCTYCIIPKIRGKQRSRSMEDILSEAEKLAEDGVKEITVIAQDTTRYGIDIDGRTHLWELIGKLCAIEGIKWVRTLYMYPEMITDELIQTLKTNTKAAPYFDIPVQHISDSVLKRMGRKSRSTEIYALVDKIRREIPEAVLRTTLIVGFPGETEEDFEQLCDFVKKARFDRLGVFEYSCEEGTPAALLDGQIDEKVKKMRAARIMQLQQKISAESRKQLLGKTVEVLAEGKNEKTYFGRSIFDAPEIDGRVFFTADDGVKAGDFVKVKVTDTSSYDIKGVMTHEHS